MTIVMAMVGCVAFAAPGTARAAPMLPDLVADPPTYPYLVTDLTGTPRLLLRFNGFVHNKGPGDLVMQGDQPVGTTMAHVVQRTFGPAGEEADIEQPGARLEYETNDTHLHWHLWRIARYSLWNEAETAEVAPGQKVGFCLLDSQRMEGPEPSRYPNPSFCGQGDPTLSSVSMGLTAGWRDIYGSSLAFQWVDVSDVQPGVYRLRSQVDPDGFVTEADDTNAYGEAAAPVTIPGYRAAAVTASDLSLVAPSTITLAADAFTSPDATTGQRRFRIETAPQHGTLDVPTGTWFAGPDVHYTPAAGSPGTDTFMFSAEDASSAFPGSPAAAAVTITLAGATAAPVAISGAPARMVAGTSVQLGATAGGGPAPGLQWSVDGAPVHGTIDANGLFRAPDVVPPGGSSTIRAATASGAVGVVTIGIDPQPAPVPSPAPSQAAASRSGPARRSATGALRELRATLRGRIVVVSVVAGRTGRLRLTLVDGTRHLASCGARVTAGRTYSCRLRAAGGGRHPLVVTATLRPRTGGRTLQRRVAVASGRH